MNTADFLLQKSRDDKTALIEASGAFTYADVGKGNEKIRRL
jgi:hypothetical protein